MSAAAKGAKVRRLIPGDEHAYVALRQAMLHAEPLSFLASPEQDRGSDVAEQRQQLEAATPEHAIFGAFAEGELVGAVGAMRPLNHAKARHKVHIWGMFVVPQWRRRGLGRALMHAALEHARSVQGVTHVELGVTEVGAAAEALYASLGFEVYGRDPAALLVDGRFIADTKMILGIGDGG